MKGRNHIRWHPWYGSTTWSVVTIEDTNLVSLNGRQIRHDVANPSKQPYILVDLEVKSEVRSMPMRFGKRSATIVVDLENDRWCYADVLRKQLQNWPPRYRFTVQHKQMILEAAASKLLPQT